MRLHFIIMDDWIAVYDVGETGKRLAQGHSLSARDMLDAIGIKYTSEDVPGEYWSEPPERAVDVPAWKSSAHD